MYDVGDNVDDVGDDVDDVGDDDGVDLSVAADSGLMQSGVAGGESEAREEQVDLDHHHCEDVCDCFWRRTTVTTMCVRQCGQTSKYCQCHSPPASPSRPVSGDHGFTPYSNNFCHNRRLRAFTKSVKKFAT